MPRKPNRSPEERLADLDQVIRQAQAAKQLVLAKERDRHRRDEQRRDILAGKICRAFLSPETLDALLDEHLSKADERALFGLSVNYGPTGDLKE